MCYLLLFKLWMNSLLLAGESRPIVVSRDDGIRADTTVEKLNKLAAAFKPGGSTTAGTLHWM